MDCKLSRRSFNSLALSATITRAILPLGFRGLSQQEKLRIAHPGMLHSKDDLKRMKDAVRAHREPIMSGFKVFEKNPNSQSTYRPLGPVATISRNPTVHVELFDSDSNAAYQCALMWCITGEHAYAKVAIDILNAWAASLKQITGADAVLCASLGGFKMMNAAELIRHSDAGWNAAQIQGASDFFRLVLLPVIRNFAPFANGNWDTAAIKCMMAIGIFCDDADLIDDALRYYLHGCGDGRLENYIYPGGQCQESGRDQQHTQLGLAHMGDVCEMAWNQGLDLYGAVANRLLEGFEFTTKYNLGSDVAFIPDHDRTGKYSHQEISPRGPLRPVYEQIFNHYVHRKKETAYYTQLAADRLRPEGGAKGADHTGFGTLLYSRSANDPVNGSVRAAVASLYAAASSVEVRLEWVPSYLASSYSISRSNSERNGYRTIASNVAQPAYVDRNLIAGQSYFYRVAPAGVDEAARQLSTVAGLPRNWSELSYGGCQAGSANVIADALVLQAYGTHPFGETDELHFVYGTLAGDGLLTARLSPLLASQQATVGLMLRAGDSHNAPMVALSISAESAGERPQWTMSLLSREAAHKPVRTLNVFPLDAPLVTYGRIVQPIWMRLSRHRDELRAYLSRDGSTWIEIGGTSLTEGQTMAGCFACSGLGLTPAQVTFEQVTLKNLSPST